MQITKKSCKMLTGSGLLLAMVALVGFCAEGAIVTPSMHLPRDGERITWQHIEWQTPIDATGGSLDSLYTWDYSHAVELDRDRTIRYINLGDSVIVSIDGARQSTYGLNGDSLLAYGIENARLMLHADTLPPLLVQLPLALGDNCISNYTYTGKYCEQNAMRSSGMICVHADAEGSLLLPDDVVTNVLRVHVRYDATVELSKDSIVEPLDTSEPHLRRCEDTYMLYSDYYPYPLVENRTLRYYMGTTSRCDSVVREEHHAYLFTPAAQDYAIQRTGSSTPLMQVKGNKTETPSFSPTTTQGKVISASVEPGGDAGSVTICYVIGNEAIDGSFSSTITSDVEITLCDLQGRVWAYVPRHEVAAGTHTETLQLSSLPGGRYLVAVTTGNSRKTQLIDR